MGGEIRSIIARIAAASALILLLQAQTAGAGRRVDVLYAGSLLIPMEKALGPAFKKKTGIDYRGEACGSVACAVLIKEGLKRPDLFISADPQVIENELFGRANSNLAYWYIEFAAARLVIAYNPRSRFAPQLDAAARGDAAWYKVLLEEGFKFGVSDPDLDPKGYRFVFAAKLAARFYGDPLAEAALSKGVKYPEQELLARLDSGQIDAIAAFAHEAVARGAPYIELPDEINLSNPKLADRYAEASYKTRYGKNYRAAPILFALTIPAGARNLAPASDFIGFLLSERGRAILERNGLEPVEPAAKGDLSSAPAQLKLYLSGGRDLGR